MAKSTKTPSTPVETPTQTLEPADTGWQPKFRLDLKNATAKDFNTLVDAFDEWAKTQTDTKIDLPDGWHVIDQELAERMLICNGGNRWPSLATVNFYHAQMAANDWKKTGESIIFDVDGKMKNGQHRTWASYLGGNSFPNYIVNQPERIEDDFAYMDSGKPRTLKDALLIGGFNGRSPVLSGVVKLARYYEAEAYTAKKTHRLPRQSSPDGIRYVKARPELRRGVNLMADSGQFADAGAAIGRKDVAAFTAATILKLHDEYVLAAFMDEVGSPLEELDEGSATHALVKTLDQDRDDVANGREVAMNPEHVLACLIKGFNAWLKGEGVSKKITFGIRVNEAFPRFLSKDDVPPQPDDEADEADEDDTEDETDTPVTEHDGEGDQPVAPAE